MVRLLHHYETSTHRIFLLLTYVDGGRLIDFVSSKRAQWNKLHEAATNPPPSSSLIMADTSKEGEKKEGEEKATPVMEDVGEDGQAAQDEGSGTCRCDYCIHVGVIIAYMYHVP